MAIKVDAMSIAKALTDTARMLSISAADLSKLAMQFEQAARDAEESKPVDTPAPSVDNPKE